MQILADLLGVVVIIVLSGCLYGLLRFCHFVYWIVWASPHDPNYKELQHSKRNHGHGTYCPPNFNGPQVQFGSSMDEPDEWY